MAPYLSLLPVRRNKAALDSFALSSPSAPTTATPPRASTSTLPLSPIASSPMSFKGKGRSSNFGDETIFDFGPAVSFGGESGVSLLNEDQPSFLCDQSGFTIFLDSPAKPNKPRKSTIDFEFDGIVPARLGSSPARLSLSPEATRAPSRSPTNTRAMTPPSPFLRNVEEEVMTIEPEPVPEPEVVEVVPEPPAAAPAPVEQPTIAPQPQPRQSMVPPPHLLPKNHPAHKRKSFAISPLKKSVSHSPEDRRPAKVPRASLAAVAKALEPVAEQPQAAAAPQQITESRPTSEAASVPTSKRQHSLSPVVERPPTKKRSSVAPKPVEPIVAPSIPSPIAPSPQPGIAARAPTPEVVEAVPTFAFASPSLQKSALLDSPGSRSTSFTSSSRARPSLQNDLFFEGDISLVLGGGLPWDMPGLEGVGRMTSTPMASKTLPPAKKASRAIVDLAPMVEELEEAVEPATELEKIVMEAESAIVVPEIEFPVLSVEEEEVVEVDKPAPVARRASRVFLPAAEQPPAPAPTVAPVKVAPAAPKPQETKKEPKLKTSAPAPKAAPTQRTKPVVAASAPAPRPKVATTSARAPAPVKTVRPAPTTKQLKPSHSVNVQPKPKQAAPAPRPAQAPAPLPVPAPVLAAVASLPSPPPEQPIVRAPPPAPPAPPAPVMAPSTVKATPAAQPAQRPLSVIRLTAPAPSREPLAPMSTKRAPIAPPAPVAAPVTKAPKPPVVAKAPLAASKASRPLASISTNLLPPVTKPAVAKAKAPGLTLPKAPVFRERTKERRKRAPGGGEVGEVATALEKQRREREAWAKRQREREDEARKFKERQRELEAELERNKLQQLRASLVSRRL